MQVEGVVTRLDGVRAYVKVQRIGGCGRCHEAGGCQSGSLADPLSKRCQEYAVDNPRGALPGARVAVEVPDGATLMAALLGYGVPVVGLLLGAAIGQYLAASDLGAVVGGSLGLFLAVVGIRGVRRSDAVRSAQPRIVDILG